MMVARNKRADLRDVHMNQVAADSTNRRSSLATPNELYPDVPAASDSSTSGKRVVFRVRSTSL